MRRVETCNRLEAKEVTIVMRFTARPYEWGRYRLKIRVSAVQATLRKVLSSYRQRQAIEAMSKLLEKYTDNNLFLQSMALGG